MHTTDDLWIVKPMSLLKSVHLLLFQMVSFHHHLLLACSKSALLTWLYKQQLASLDHGDCHTFLCCVTLDLNLQLPKDMVLECFIQQANENKSEFRLNR